MPFRDDIDLSGIVSKFEIFQAKKTEPGPKWIPPGEGDDPAKAGYGPISCSTSTGVAECKRYFSWDVNRYYRDLGIPWPYIQASKADLRRAYQALEGQSSPRLTYCLKQLVTVREAYDAMPLGQQFLDRYVMAQIRRKAREEAERLNNGIYDEAIRDKILSNWGYVIKPIVEEENPNSIRGIDASEMPELDSHASESETYFYYSYYLWKSKHYEPARLIAWQSALIRAINHRVPNLTVGVMGKHHSRFAVMEKDGRWVVFLHEDEEITDELARSAVTALMKQVTKLVTED